jgi:hypothetical protein
MPKPNQPISSRAAKSRSNKRPRVAQERYGEALLKSCNIVRTTVLISPNRTALALIQVGDTLDIEFRPGPPPLLVAMTPAGTAAGAISCTSTTQIVECIQRGFRYVAKVLTLRQKSCKVRVQLSREGC